MTFVERVLQQIAQGEYKEGLIDSFQGLQDDRDPDLWTITAFMSSPELYRGSNKVPLIKCERNAIEDIYFALAKLQKYEKKLAEQMLRI